MIALLINNCSETESCFSLIAVKSRALWRVLGGAVALLTTVIFVPFIRHLLHFAKVCSGAIAESLFTGGVCSLSFEAIKWGMRFYGKESEKSEKRKMNWAVYGRINSHSARAVAKFNN